MSQSGIGTVPRRAPGSGGAATLLAGALAAADLAALLLVVPVPAVLALAPLLVRGDQVDLGFARIDTPLEAWPAAALGSILLVAIASGTLKAVRAQRAWIDRQFPQPGPAPRAAGPADPTATRFQGLTERETQVLELMSRGFTNGAIAQRLFISEATVRKHVGRIFAKLDMDTTDKDRRVTAALTFAGHADDRT
ncbi:LuxR C-terminal-related transcriptional regulator [Glycomyces sp. A-F 0318]|uniref:helix-turn-helix transcriptional regulator n=1 Tax=Glycomyces amatae TaxID=2881355 RepID=UPI001E4FC3A7|nr:LuxR C-terminal-related transcriptional regulator [Glycomyces amatae]MCD0443675.1 LuxR C-terminal-related transcriptional regulator [Glycomyces amatae]